MNNLPIKYLENIFGIIDDLDLKLHFYIIILKKGSSLSTTSKFIIIPKGIFYSHLRSNIWINFCDKFLMIFIKFLFKNDLKNLGLILLLIVYYLEKLIKLKLNNYINCIKFYSKEERLESIGNYYQFCTDSFKLYCKNYSKISKNELLFNYSNIIDNYSLTLDFKYYYLFLSKSDFNLDLFKFFEFENN